MFKSTWEKTVSTHQLPDAVIEKKVRLAYPNKELTSHESIAGGCSNLNIKFQLKNESKCLISSVYLCDKDAAYREGK